MKTYRYKIHDNYSGGMINEIRSPVIEDLGNPSNGDVFRVGIPPTNIVNLIEENPLNSINANTVTIQEQLFETICFRTMIWVEEYATNDASCGHYRIYNSYASIPYGASIPTEDSESERYVERIRESELRLKEEECKIKNEESVSYSYFDDTDFILE